MKSRGLSAGVSVPPSIWLSCKVHSSSHRPAVQSPADRSAALADCSSAAASVTRAPNGVRFIGKKEIILRVDPRVRRLWRPNASRAQAPGRKTCVCPPMRWHNLSASQFFYVVFTGAIEFCRETPSLCWLWHGLRQADTPDFAKIRVITIAKHGDNLLGARLNNLRCSTLYYRWLEPESHGSGL